MNSKWIAVAVLFVIAVTGCRSVHPGIVSKHQAERVQLTNRGNPSRNGDPGHQDQPTTNESFVRQVCFQAPEMTLADLEQLALSNNPAVTQVQAEIESLRGKLNQAGLPPNPRVGIAGDDINEDGSAGRYGIFFGREVVRGNKLGLSRAVVCAEIQAAEQRLSVVQQRLLTDVRQAYYELLVAQETVIVATELLDLSQKAVDTSRQLYEAKEAAQTAVLQSKLELQNATVVKRQAENRRLAARRQLSTLLGQSDLPTDEVAGDVRELGDLDEFEQSFDQLVSNSPEIAALFAEVETARRQLARQCVEPIANVTWQTTLQYGTLSDDVIAGFQVGIPIPTVNRNQGAIYQARQQITVAKRERRKKGFGIKATTGKRVRNLSGRQVAGGCLQFRNSSDGQKNV